MAWMCYCVMWMLYANSKLGDSCCKLPVPRWNCTTFYQWIKSPRHQYFWGVNINTDMPVSVYLFSLFNSNLVVSCLYTLLSSPAAVFMTTESRRGRSVRSRCPGLHLGILRSDLQHYYRMRHCRHRVVIYTFTIRWKNDSKNLFNFPSIFRGFWSLLYSGNTR